MKNITELWIDHKDGLRNYIRKRVKDHHFTDDILQEIFLKAYTNLHTIKSSGSIPAWLYQIANNTINDYYRTRKPTVELSIDFSIPEKEKENIAELAACIQPMIKELPEIYSAALTMSEIEGITQKEVAKRLGISVSGAKSRVQRGREKLLERLSQCCEIEINHKGKISCDNLNKNCDCGDS